MTFDEALRELGIDAGADAPSVRRAYLRAARRHSPERDPEGFLRVRQALECVSAELGSGQSSGRPARPEPDGAEPPADALEPSAVEARAADTADDAAAPPPRVESEERIAAGRRAARARPDSADAWEELVDALESAGHTDEAAQALCDAERAGAPGFAERILYDVPERASPELLCRAERATSPWLRLAAAAALRQRGETVRAAKILTGLLADADDGSLPPPVVWGYLDTLQALLAAREHDAALGLRDGLAREFAPGSELAVLAPHAERWALANELLAVYPFVPPPLWSPLLAPLAARPQGPAEREVRAFAAERPLVAAHLAHELEHRAPALFATFGAALAPPEPAWQSWARRAPRNVVILGWVLALLLMAGFWAAMSRGPDLVEPERVPGEAPAGEGR
ncbi:MAG: hypothetical protein IT373_29435 [Polyangiaceae bacterium]|nr:hypothetical protein [Polyangiaceae bacterium]